MSGSAEEGECRDRGGVWLRVRRMEGLGRKGGREEEEEWSGGKQEDGGARREKGREEEEKWSGGNGGWRDWEG